jgi:hypothetical protein
MAAQQNSYSFQRHIPRSKRSLQTGIFLGVIFICIVTVHLYHGSVSGYNFDAWNDHDHGEKLTKYLSDAQNKTLGVRDSQLTSFNQIPF